MTASLSKSPDLARSPRRQPVSQPRPRQATGSRRTSVFGTPRIRFRRQAGGRWRCGRRPTQADVLPATSPALSSRAYFRRAYFGLAGAMLTRRPHFGAAHRARIDHPSTVIIAADEGDPSFHSEKSTPCKFLFGPSPHSGGWRLARSASQSSASRNSAGRPRGSAEQFAQERANTAVVAALVPFCVTKAQQDPDKAVLAKLRAEDSPLHA